MRRFALPFLMFGALTACEEHVPGELPRTGEVIETVGTKNVTQGMVDAMLSTLPDGYKEQLEAAGQLDSLQEQMITQEVLYQEAMAKGLQNDPVVKNMLAVAEREALIEALLREVADERTTDEALKAFYDENQVRYRTSQLRLVQVVKDDEESANAAAAALESGTPVAEVEGAQDMGLIDARQVPPNISMTAPGKSVAPFNQGGKWIVVFVADKVDQVTPFEEVKDAIKAEVQRTVVEEYVEELKGEKLPKSGEATVTETPAVPEAH